MSTKPPADPAMERGVNPVRPATAPTPRKPAAPPPKSSGFQRFLLQFLLLVIALGGAFGTGYLVNANEMQLDRSDLLQQQLDAQERILALEQQIAELRETRESGNRVELDLTEVFEPIREAVGRIALVRMGEISREITTELSRLVEADLPALDDSANATGAAAPGAMRGGIDNGGAAGPAPRPGRGGAGRRGGRDRQRRRRGPGVGAGGGVRGRRACRAAERRQSRFAAAEQRRFRSGRPPPAGCGARGQRVGERCAAPGDGSAGGLALGTGERVAGGRPRTAGGCGGAGRRRSLAFGSPGTAGRRVGDRTGEPLHAGEGDRRRRAVGDGSTAGAGRRRSDYRTVKVSALRTGRPRLTAVRP